MTDYREILSSSGLEVKVDKPKKIKIRGSDGSVSCYWCGQYFPRGRGYEPDERFCSEKCFGNYDD